MPVYTYECQAKKCGEIFEEYQKMADEPLAKCSICKRGKVIRIISLPARPVVSGDPREELQKARLEGKKMAKEIMRGNQEVIADVYGEDVAAGKDPKPRANAPKPKTLDQVKGGKIKRRSP